MGSINTKYLKLIAKLGSIFSPHPAIPLLCNGPTSPRGEVRVWRHCMRFESFGLRVGIWITSPWGEVAFAQRTAGEGI